MTAGTERGRITYLNIKRMMGRLSLRPERAMSRFSHDGFCCSCGCAILFPRSRSGQRTHLTGTEGQRSQGEEKDWKQRIISNHVCNKQGRIRCWVRTGDRQDIESGDRSEFKIWKTEDEQEQEGQDSMSQQTRHTLLAQLGLTA